MTYLVATDIGGTFTDLVAFDLEAGTLVQAKSHTDPGDLTGGVLRCIDKAGLDMASVREFVHGSTVAINTVIERKGAKTALLVTRGTRDVYAIGRGNRPESYNLSFRRPEPLVPRSRTLELAERLDAAGRVVEALDRRSVEAAIAQVLEEGCESVAVCLLHSYANPEHEDAVGAQLRARAGEVFLSLSHEILREYREYERTSTTVLNGYVGPRVSRYLEALEGALRDRGLAGVLLVMQSNGGVMAPSVARRQPVRTMESGPVGGAIAAGQLARRLGIAQAVAFDMGGTTAKAALIRDGEPEMSEGYFVGGTMRGYPVMLPVVDVIEVGAGGGSIASVDAVGSLRIGPQSAGGYPGPICYGWGGTEPTVTDANAVLGRLNPHGFLGGEMPLDVESASDGIARKLAGRLSLPVDDAAQAIVDVAVNTMALAVRAVSVERGLDPRDCALVAFGGAGPLHAADVARELSIPLVVVPLLPGHYSALGMLLSELRHDLVRTWFARLADVDPAALESVFGELGDEGDRLLAEEGVAAASRRAQRFVDLRYVGQEFTLRVPVGSDGAGCDLDAVRRRFDELHDERYGHCAPHEPVELVNVRLVALGRRDVSAPRVQPNAAPPSTEGSRVVGFRAGRRAVRRICAIHRREALPIGAAIAGPAVIEEEASTVILDEGDSLTVGESGELLVKVEPRGGALR